MTIFAKHFILGVSHGYEYTSDRIKQNFGALSLISRQINHKLNTLFFDFKLIHPCSWILRILISHYLPDQTHHNNYRPTFSNFLGESKEIESKLLYCFNIMVMSLSTVSRCQIVYFNWFILDTN